MTQEESADRKDVGKAFSQAEVQYLNADNPKGGCTDSKGLPEGVMPPNENQ